MIYVLGVTILLILAFTGLEPWDRWNLSQPVSSFQSTEAMEIYLKQEPFLKCSYSQPERYPQGGTQHNM
jgi:hypothetical protein